MPEGSTSTSFKRAGPNPERSPIRSGLERPGSYNVPFASAWRDRGHPLERAAAVGPRRQMQERAEGAVDERRERVQGKIAHIALPQVEVHARLDRPVTGVFEHGLENSPPGPANPLVGPEAASRGGSNER